MAGWDYYVLEKQDVADPKDLFDRLATLGSQSWELVAVDGGTMYFKRYEQYEANLRVGVAAENQNSHRPLFDWVANEAAGEKRLNAISTTDSGPGTPPHNHRVIAIVNSDMVVVKGATDEVNGHVHPVTFVGTLDESCGHTHLFTIENGGLGTFQY